MLRLPDLPQEALMTVALQDRILQPMSTPEPVRKYKCKLRLQPLQLPAAWCELTAPLPVTNIGTHVGTELRNGMR